MTCGEARELVTLLRRRFLITTLTRAVLLIVIGLSVFAAWVSAGSELYRRIFWGSASGAGLAWVALMFFSIRQARASNQAMAFIASGRLDLAEERLRGALQQFSFFRNGLLLACHNLAVVAHGRQCYPAAAELCEGVLSLHKGIRKGLSRGIGRTCRILLADCRLFLGDAASALRAIEPISLDDPVLNLSEQLLFLPVELRCRIAQADYAGATANLPWKLRRAELLDSPKAALVHALLAEACRRTGQSETAAFLQGRAELYHDLDELEDQYGKLRDSTGNPNSTDNNQDNATITGQ